MFEVEDFSCPELVVGKSLISHKNLNVERKKMNILEGIVHWGNVIQDVGTAHNRIAPQEKSSMQFKFNPYIGLWTKTGQMETNSTLEKSFLFLSFP